MSNINHWAINHKNHSKIQEKQPTGIKEPSRYKNSQTSNHQLEFSIGFRSLDLIVWHKPLFTRFLDPPFCFILIIQLGLPAWARGLGRGKGEGEGGGAVGKVERGKGKGRLEKGESDLGLGMVPFISFFKLIRFH